MVLTSSLKTIQNVPLKKKKRAGNQSSNIHSTSKIEHEIHYLQNQGNIII